jgi:predicted DNA-binding protein (MmcQ/YjbR family)
MSKPQTGGRKQAAPAKAASKPTTKTAKVTTRSAAKPAKSAKSAKLAKPAKSAPSSDDVTFEKIRALCLALPGTKLTMTWGSPHFRVGEKIFCGFGVEPDGRPVMGVKLGLEHARKLVKEARFWPAPYVGKHGWVSMDVAKRKSWDEVAALIRESYELIAPKAPRRKVR